MILFVEMETRFRTNLLLWVVFWFLLPLCRGDIDLTKHEVEIVLTGNPVRDRRFLEEALELFHSSPRSFALNCRVNEKRKNSIHYFDLWVSNPLDYKPFACRLSLAIKYNEIGRISSIDFIYFMKEEDKDKDKEEAISEKAKKAIAEANRRKINAYFSAFTRVFLPLTQYGSPLRVIGKTSIDIESIDISKLSEEPESCIKIAAESGLMEIVGVKREEMFRLASKVLIGFRGIQTIVLKECGPELKKFDLVGGSLVKTDVLFGEHKEINNVITELDIIGCKMGGNMPKNLQLLSELKVIKLFDCEDVDVKKICLEKGKIVESLVLKKSGLSKQDFVELAKSLKGVTVIKLDLSDNVIDSIDTPDVLHLHFLINFCETRLIDLTGNRLSHKSKTLLMPLFPIVRLRS
ncbi:MAG: hypothetical protein ACSW8C_04920 [bacterium]